MFSGFRSRWITPLQCMYATASYIFARIRMISSSSRWRRYRMSLNKWFPEQYSMIRYTCYWSSKMPYSFTMFGWFRYSWILTSLMKGIYSFYSFIIFFYTDLRAQIKPLALCLNKLKLTWLDILSRTCHFQFPPVI